MKGITSSKAKKQKGSFRAKNKQDEKVSPAQCQYDAKLKDTPNKMILAHASPLQQQLVKPRLEETPLAAQRRFNPNPFGGESFSAVSHNFSFSIIDEKFPNLMNFQKMSNI